MERRLTSRCRKRWRKLEFRSWPHRLSWPFSCGNFPTLPARRPSTSPVAPKLWFGRPSSWLGRKFWRWECSESRLGLTSISLRPLLTPCRFKSKLDNSPSIFATPVRMESLAIHPEMISEATQNVFGLDLDHDTDSKDDVVTAEMAVPANREIHLLMHSKDVGHSFFVPELRVQQDFVPGLDLSLHFTATKTGRYEIVCTQLCGLGHYNMKAYLSVMSQQDFEEWLKKQGASQ